MLLLEATQQEPLGMDLLFMMIGLAFFIYIMWMVQSAHERQEAEKRKDEREQRHQHMIDTEAFGYKSLKPSDPDPDSLEPDPNTPQPTHKKEIRTS